MWQCYYHVSAVDLKDITLYHPSLQWTCKKSQGGAVNGSQTADCLCCILSVVCAVYYMSCLCWHLLFVPLWNRCAYTDIHLTVYVCVYLYVRVLLPCFTQLRARRWLEERLWPCASHLGYPYKLANHNLLPCKRSFIEMSACTSHNTVTQHHKNMHLFHNNES